MKIVVLLCVYVAAVRKIRFYAPPPFPNVSLFFLSFFFGGTVCHSSFSISALEQFWLFGLGRGMSFTSLC